MRLIVKSSISKLSDNSFKSNLGDVIRATVLLNCFADDCYMWLTDNNGKKILKYFIPEEKILVKESAEEVLSVTEFNDVYYLDNYLLEVSFWKYLTGSTVYGFLHKTGEAANDYIKAIMPYAKINSMDISWQEALVKGCGFDWKEQDYYLPINSADEKYDVGLNWHVHPDWPSKSWPKQSWEALASSLRDVVSVSFQQGLNNMDEYINWLGSCRCIITSDSLAVHLASALRKNVIVLIGPTDNREYSYDRVQVLCSERKMCLFCNNPNCNEKVNCMEMITVDNVIASFKKCIV